MTGENCVYIFSKTWSGILKRKIWFFISFFLNSELSQYDDEERRGKIQTTKLVIFCECPIHKLNFIIIV